jgi:hypothetical protein
MPWVLFTRRKQILSLLNKFKFFLSGLIDPIKENDPIWSSQLPVSRIKASAFNNVPVTYGDYFNAAEAFLSKNHFQRLLSSVYQQSKTPIFPETIENISIILEKHGEYYHPSKIEVTAKKQQWQFVLNVAVSEAGLNCAQKEFELLTKLSSEMPWNFIPAVYEYGEVNPANAGSDFRMFLGQWFSGFNEFHIHSIDQDGNCRIEVWDQAKGNFFLSEKQAYELYRQTALILTCYHNLESFEQIHPWHHAAGDFVVKVEDNLLKVKLVTARGYCPIVRNDEKDLGSLLEVLLVFLMDLSIKNRIDRFNGVGDLALADDIYVMATIDGFYEGLSQKIQRNIISRKFLDYFGIYLNSLTHSAIEELFTDIIAAWPQQAQELTIVKPSIESHALIFESFANRFLSKQFNKECQF